MSCFRANIDGNQVKNSGCNCCLPPIDKIMALDLKVTRVSLCTTTWNPPVLPPPLALVRAFTLEVH
jgi:hypothetical protein